MDTLPWWAFAGLSFLLLHHPEFDAAPWGSRRGAAVHDQNPSNVDELQGRMLGAWHDATNMQSDAKEVVDLVDLVEDEDKEEKEEKFWKGVEKKENKEKTEKKEKKEKKEKNETKEHVHIPDFNITVPCVSIPFKGLVAKPCGKLTVGGKGVDIKTLFGTKHIPGTNVLKPYVKEAEQSFEHYTVYLVGATGALYGLFTLASASRREQFVQNIKDMLAGKLEEDDPTEEQTDKEADLADRLDPKSANFIAPGNIYRLLAVLHPGVIGYQQWGKFAFKAFVCAYMQLFLPFKIIKGVFEDWTLHGFKSPLWFMAEGGAFITMFISVGSLCNLFAARCAENIRIGAEANFHILTHCSPKDVAAANGSYLSLQEGNLSARGSTRELQVQGELEEAIPSPVPDAPPKIDGVPSIALPMIPLPVLSHTMITANEYFWCCMSLTCNVLMSFLLFFAMFLKIATFTGQISDVAVVAVSLYFVFDLDAKVMDSDPKLRPKYRHAVLKQTAENEYKPMWLMTIAAISKAMLGMLTPLGLVSIVLFSWKSDHMVIGGDPF